MDLSPTERPDAFPGVISVLENLGTHTLVTLETPSTTEAAPGTTEITTSTTSTTETTGTTEITPGTPTGATSTSDTTDGTPGPLIQLVVPEGHEPPLGTPAWAVPRRALLYRDDTLHTSLP